MDYNTDDWMDGRYYGLGVERTTDKRRKDRVPTTYGFVDCEWCEHCGHPAIMDASEHGGGYWERICDTCQYKEYGYHTQRDRRRMKYIDPENADAY